MLHFRCFLFLYCVLEHIYLSTLTTMRHKWGIWSNLGVPSEDHWIGHRCTRLTVRVFKFSSEFLISSIFTPYNFYSIWTYLCIFSLFWCSCKSSRRFGAGCSIGCCVNLLFIQCLCPSLHYGTIPALQPFKHSRI